MRGAGARMACGVGSAASQSLAEGCPRLGSNAAALTLRCRPPQGMNLAQSQRAYCTNSGCLRACFVRLQPSLFGLLVSYGASFSFFCSHWIHCPQSQAVPSGCLGYGSCMIQTRKKRTALPLFVFSHCLKHWCFFLRLPILPAPRPTGLRAEGHHTYRNA